MMQFTNIPQTWRFRSARAGIQIGDLAKGSGVPRVSLSAYINTHRQPPLEVVDKVENYLAKMGEPFKLEYVQDE